MRIVVDTNVVIAGMLWDGPPRRLFEAAVAGTIRLATSAAMVDELARALTYRRLARRLDEQRLSASTVVARYALLSDVIAAASIPATVLSDPDDDQVLACALGANADLIVSGDTHLLNLKAYQGIPIVSATEALQRLPKR